MTKVNKVGFQGERGAYSHIASLKIFPKAEIKTCKTFDETFRLAAENNDVRIVVPIENSLAGRVADIHYLLPKYKLQIHSEFFLNVEHNLLACKGTKIETIKKIRSHGQAIGQCQKIINKYNLEPIIAADTAGSAKYLSLHKSTTEAAIASELSAKIYGLEILKKNIEDETGNVTRFLVMGKEKFQPDYEKEKKYITSCIFRLKSIPSALYKCLGGFATNQINLTKLESFSVKNSFEQVNFYLDFEGHLENDSVKKALEELGFHTETLEILGVYEAHEFRSA